MEKNQYVGLITECNNVEKGAEVTLETNSPTLVNYGIYDSEGKEIVLPVIMIPEEAFHYLMSKCHEDELWDLRFLGASEAHIKVKEMPKKILDYIAKNKNDSI